MKSLHEVPRFLLLFILLTVALSVRAGDREALSREVEQALDVCELYYDDGRYQEALKQCRKVMDKYKGKGYAQLMIRPTLAKYQLAMGNFMQFGQEVDKYLKQTAHFREKESVAYGLALLEVADLYLSYQHALPADTLLEKATKLLERRGERQDKSRLTAIQGKLALVQGAYREAIEKFSEALRNMPEPKLEHRVFDPITAEYVVRTRSDREWERAKNAYASLMNQRAEAALAYGDFRQAETYLNESQRWIEQNLTNRDIAYIENRHIAIRLQLERGEPRRPIEKQLDKLLFRAEKHLGKAHHLYLDIQETLIEYFVDRKYLRKQSQERNPVLQLNFLTRNRERRRSNFQLWDINQSSKLYYGKNGVTYAQTQRLDAEQQMKRQDLAAAKRILMPLYKDHKVVPKNHPERFRLARQLYRIALEQNQLEEARRYLEESIRRIAGTMGEESLTFQMAQIEKARYLFNYTNQFDSAKTLLDTYTPRVLERLKPVQRRALKTRNALADYHEMTDNYESARQEIDKNLEIIAGEYGKKHVRYATELVRKIDLLMLQSRYSEVDSLINRTLLIFDAEFNPNLNEDYALALETAAHYNATMGLYEEAKEQLQDARNQYFLHAGIFNRSRDLEKAALSENADELAYLYIQSEEYERAARLLDLMVEERQRIYGKRSRFLVSPYNQLARLRRIEGEYTEADDYINTAFEIARNNYGEEALKITETLEIRADIKTSIGDYSGAKEDAERALQIKEKLLGQENIALANTYVQLAIINYYDKEAWEEVETLLDKAERIARQKLGSQNPVYANILQNTASIYLEQGDYQKAEENLLQARRIWLVLSEDARKKIADIDVLIAQVDIQNENYADAEEKLQEALRDYKKIFSKAHPDYISTKADLARLYYTMGEEKDAEKNIYFVLEAHKRFIRENFPVLSDREKAKAWDQRREDFEFFTNFALQEQNRNPALLRDAYNNVLITKSVLLSTSKSVRNKILNSGNDSLIANYNRWVDSKNELIRAIGLSQNQLEEAGIDLKSLQNEVAELEKTLSRQSSDFVSREEAITWEDVQGALSENEYAVEVLRFRHYNKKDFSDSVAYGAFLLRAEGKPAFIPIPEGEKLETSYLKRYRNSMKYSIPDYASYKKFWKPIDEKIPDGARIYFSADQAYTNINPESLLLESGDYLIDKDEILFVTTTRDLVRLAKKDETRRKLPKNMALFGNPLFYPDQNEAGGPPESVSRDDVQPLPGAQAEVETIRDKLSKRGDYNIQVYIREEATEERIRALTQQEKRPGLYHFATHGFFKPDISNAELAVRQRLNTADNPLLRSGLLFANAGELIADGNYFAFNRKPGVLTAAEVTSMNFEGADVLLSACETARGDAKVGEGVYGLQRAFLIAGAETLIMSLFKVDDDATRALMTIYYTKREAGMDMQTAFREAKQELRQEFPEPIYWGAFVPLGG